MVNQLFDLDIDEVSLVDRPANMRKLLLFKAEDGKPATETAAAVQKAGTVSVTLAPGATFSNSGTETVVLTLSAATTTSNTSDDAPATGADGTDKAMHGKKPEDMDEEHEEEMDEEGNPKKPKKPAKGKAEKDAAESEDMTEEQEAGLLAALDALAAQLASPK